MRLVGYHVLLVGKYESRQLTLVIWRRVRGVKKNGQEKVVQGSGSTMKEL